MGYSICFVPGCKTGTTADRKERQLAGQKHLGMFSAPRDPELFEKWKKRIPRGDREFTMQDRICELHFGEDEIERYFVTKLPDGSVSKIERAKLLLNPGSIPHNFNLPTCSSKDGYYNLMKNNEEENSDEGTTWEMAIRLIKAPDELWAISSTPEFIICTKWNPTYSPERRVIIENDLNVKVFIKDHEIHTDEILSVSSIEDISRLLLEVDSYIICPGIDDDKYMTNCMKYIKRTKVKGQFSVRCRNCQSAKKRIYDSARHRKKSEINKFKKMPCFACALRKSSLQKQKIESNLQACPRDSTLTSTEHSTDIENSPEMKNCIVVAEFLIGDSCVNKHT